MSTVQFIRRLPRYSVVKQGSPEDPVVRDILNECVEQETIEALDNYTRGMYTESLHYESFMRYQRPIEEDLQNGQRLLSHPSFKVARESVLELLQPLYNTKIMSLSDIDQVEWIPSSAAGYGYYGTKAENYELAKANALRAYKDFRLYQHKYKFVPDKAFARSQLALRANPKIRHVWGRAFHHILLEGLIAQPLIQKLLITDTPIFVGKDIHKDMPYTVIKIIDEGGFCYCLDFTGFDAYASSTLVSVAWDVLKSLIVIDSFEKLTIYEFVKHLFTHTPVVMPDGRLYLVIAGIPSGSYFTQLIDSIINLLLICMLLHHHNCLALRTIKVLGDDSIFALSRKEISLSDAVRFFRPFGMEVSDKSVITDKFSEIIFLGHNFYGSRVTRDEFTCLSLALYSEELISSVEHTLIRIASLIYDSGFNSRTLNRIYKIILHEHRIDWKTINLRPVTTRPPFAKLFILG